MTNWNRILVAVAMSCTLAACGEGDKSKAANQAPVAPKNDVVKTTQEALNLFNEIKDLDAGKIHQLSEEGLKGLEAKLAHLAKLDTQLDQASGNPAAKVQTFAHKPVLERVAALISSEREIRQSPAPAPAVTESQEQSAAPNEQSALEKAKQGVKDFFKRLF